MESSHTEKLDNLIADALHSEPQQSVPRLLHAHVMVRVRIAAIAAQERRRFRANLLAGAAILLVPLVLAGGSAALLGTFAGQAWAVPGGAGYYIDSLSAVISAQFGPQVSLWLAALFPALCLLSALRLLNRETTRRRE